MVCNISCSLRLRETNGDISLKWTKVFLAGSTSSETKVQGKNKTKLELSFPEVPFNYVPHVHAAPLTEHEMSLLPIRMFTLDLIYMTFGGSVEDDPTYFRLSLSLLLSKSLLLLPGCHSNA